MPNTRKRGGVRKYTKNTPTNNSENMAQFPSIKQFEELQKELSEKNSTFKLNMLTNATNSSNVSKVFRALRMKNKYTKRKHHKR